MIWRDLGVVWKPDASQEFARTHAMGPTPIQVNDDVIRIYLTCLDENGIGRPSFVEVSSEKPNEVLREARCHLLDVGLPGTFDDNGLMVTSIVKVTNSTYYMYYAGFEICEKIRYRILSGVAISIDGGITFSRYASTPVLERSQEELYFRGGPYVLQDEGIFKMWYVGGKEWLEIEGKQMPVYDLKYLESNDGLTWGQTGKTILSISESDEHGFGRPWVVISPERKFELYYSIRRKSLASYRLGYANSKDGTNWVRNDGELNLDVKEGTSYSKAIMYSAVIEVKGKIYCFYNGNNFGENGFSVSELIS